MGPRSNLLSKTNNSRKSNDPVPLINIADLVIFTGLYQDSASKKLEPDPTAKYKKLEPDPTVLLNIKNWNRILLLNKKKTGTGSYC